MIRGLHHIAVNVAQRDRSLAFYQNALGFTVISETPRPQRQDILLFLEGHGVTLELFVDPTRPARLTYPEALGLRHLCLRVTEIEEERERFLALGYDPEPLRGEEGRRMFFVMDPDGSPIEFHE